MNIIQKLVDGALLLMLALLGVALFAAAVSPSHGERLPVEEIVRHLQ